MDLLVTGKTDKETAELVNLSRTCVTKWLLYDPVFQAALNRRREEVWGTDIGVLTELVLPGGASWRYTDRRCWCSYWRLTARKQPLGRNP
jgi:hypothetical protein